MIPAIPLTAFAGPLSAATDQFTRFRGKATPGTSIILYAKESFQ